MSEALAEPVWVERHPAAGLPFFLLDAYEFFAIEFFGRRFLAMCERAGFDAQPTASPATIAKHIEVCAEKTGLPCIYVAEAITAYNRERLIKQRVQFVIPGNQMFLPSLGLDLREYYRKALRPKESIALKPAAQAVILFLLARSRQGEFHLTDLAAEMGYTKMTISRVVEELDGAKLIKAEQRGRAKMVTLNGDRRGVWEKALPMLQTPVWQIHRVESCYGDSEVFDAVEAGETALAQYTNLNEPARRVVAVTKDQWTRARLKDVPDGDLEVEVWRYNPKLLAQHNRAHPLTLFLRFRGHEDERVEMAVRDMMKHYEWEGKFRW